MFLWGYGEKAEPLKSAAAPSEQLAAIAPSAGPVATPSAPALAAPSFDLVRVAPDGNAVIAGRAAPNAQVTVTDGAAVLGTATADGRGEWVIVPEKKLPPGDRQLTLRAIQPGTGETVKGDADVVLSIAPPEKGRAAAPSGSSGPALAVLVPNTPGAVARPLQRPGEATRSAAGGLGIDIVEYDAEGRVVLSGRAEPNAEVKLSLNGRTLATTRAGPDGKWTAQPQERVASGVYSLRVDELRDGRVTNRLAVPFQRAEPPPGGTPGEFLVVQPGHSLWRIARQTYGAGLRYTEVYAANRAQIANPDLIFPGQIFKLPAN